MGLTVPLPPPLLSTIPSPATICESAARLLFMNVKWAKNVPSFTNLPLSDQLILLEESWRELFILGAAQFMMPLELAPLINACGFLERERDRTVSFLNEVKEFQDTLSKLAQFRLDPHEFACLRAIVLFKTPSSSGSLGEEKSLADALSVAAVQDHTQLTLNKYISAAQPGQPLRFGKLLLLLPTLRTVSSETIEELFFRKTIGNIPIVRIICDMYKSSNSDIL